MVRFTAFLCCCRDDINEQYGAAEGFRLSSVLPGHTIHGIAVCGILTAASFYVERICSSCNVSGSCLGGTRFESRLDHRFTSGIMSETIKCLQSLHANTGHALNFGTVFLFHNSSNSPFTVSQSYDAIIQGCTNPGIQVFLTF
jgi:hypothetical protein